MAVTTRSQTLKMPIWTPTRQNYKLSRREMEAAKVLTSITSKHIPSKRYNLRNTRTSE